MPITIAGGESSISVTAGQNGFNVQLSIGNNDSAIQNVVSIAKGTIIPLSFSESVDCDNLNNYFGYNPHGLSSTSESDEFIYFVITDNDCKFKVPVLQNGNILKQKKSDKSIVDEAPTTEIAQKLIQQYDTITVNTATVTNDTLINNIGGATLEVDNDPVPFEMISAEILGNEGHIKSVLVPDAIYNLEEFTINDQAFNVALAVINHIWHVLFAIPSRDTVALSSVGLITPVTDIDEGTPCKLDSLSMLGFWCDEWTTQDEKTIEEITAALKQFIPTEFVGEPIQVWADGETLPIPFGYSDRTFSTL